MIFVILNLMYYFFILESKIILVTIVRNIIFVTKNQKLKLKIN